jgi:hypothetical protein
MSTAALDPTNWSIGDERIVLAGEDGRPGLHKLERQIRCEGGEDYFWDESARDYIEAPGHWVTVETLGRGFEGTGDARKFMLRREAE